MKNLLTLLSLLFVLQACCTKKDASSDYVSGTIHYSEAEKDCEYTIRVNNNGTNTFYDPINLESGFMKDGLKVQFQFRPLKMKNRCDKANPISLINIK